MLVTLINPQILDKRGNFTYAVDFPLGLAYIASYLLSKKIEVKVIDAVGMGLDRRRRYKRDYCIIGISNEEIIRRIDPASDIIAVSARFTTQHGIVKALIGDIKTAYPVIPLVLGGNHATYHYQELLDAGADYVVLGEGEVSFYNLSLFIRGKLPGKALKGVADKEGLIPIKKAPLIQNLDSLPFPARMLFPLDRYYRERSGHGPANARFTPIVTSRGCPCSCTFCASRVFWQNTWRPRSAGNVLDEMEECIKRYGIKEFQFDDDNLTLDRRRVEELCRGMISRGFRITWGATNGIRPENMDSALLSLMKKSGCVQLTLAPESGSQRVLREIYKKDIDLAKIEEIVSSCDEMGIRTTAYILIGAIGEKAHDRKLTLQYVKRLAVAGLDELGVFPVVPYPECDITESYRHVTGEANWEELVTGIVPGWYPDYRRVKAFRRRLYLAFLGTQLRYHPSKPLRLIRNLLIGRQDVKSDRTLKNMFRLAFASLRMPS